MAKFFLNIDIDIHRIYGIYTYYLIFYLTTRSGPGISRSMGAQCAGGLWMFGGLHHSSKASEEFHGDFMGISW